MTSYVWQPEWELLESEEENMPTVEHGVICTNIITALNLFLKGKGLGRVLDSSVEYRFLEPPKGKTKKRPRFPDVTFIRQERLPQNMRSYPEVAPDLAVEVASPTDRDYDIEARVKEYQKVGVKQVWVIHPYSRTIDLYRLENGLLCQRIGINGELLGEDQIPGFKLKVGEIFDYPPPPDETEE
ncbi:MAG: Uma2 family endonuclease [Chloroflexi bacterium]|nr:Uma2 family endonuclease [Chloroflexota bacterium]